MSLDRVAGELEAYLDQVNRAMFVDCYERLWDATPVLTGYARSRWQGFYDGEGQAVIENDADYIQYLNAGTSEQAPAGFVQKAIAGALGVDYSEDEFDFEGPEGTADLGPLGGELDIPPGPVSPNKDEPPPDVL